MKLDAWKMVGAVQAAVGAENEGAVMVQQK
jgi:hypothetical protein